MLRRLGSALARTPAPDDNRLQEQPASSAAGNPPVLSAKAVEPPALEAADSHLHVAPSDTPSSAPLAEDRLHEALRKAGVKESHIRVSKQRQQLTEEPLTEIMRSSEYGFLTPEKTAKVNAVMAGLDYFPPSKADHVPFADILEALKKRGIQKLKFEGIVPVDHCDGELTLALSEEKDINTAQFEFQGFRQRYVVASERTLQGMFRRFYARSGEEAMELYARIKKMRPDQEGGDLLLREFVLSVMRHACYLGASDLSFTPMVSSTGGVVRMKIDRDGSIFTFLEQEVWSRVITHLVSSTGSQEKITRGPVDTRFTFKPEEEDKFKDLVQRYAFRVVLLPRGMRTRDESLITVVMRILDQQADTSEIEQLGFDNKTLTTIQGYAARSTGMVLVTGPTGSGKTTTLYATLNLIDPVANWIQSIENPIEYSKGLWMQFQTQGENEADGAYQLLKGLLRAAPEVILVGEIRKGDMGAEALDAANTGHLVLSTLHTNNAALTLSRLKNFDLDMSALASLLLGVLAQRLVKTLCTCAVADDRTETLNTLRNLKYLEASGEPKPKRPMGCINCNQSGYRGRRMIYELLDVSPRVRDLIESGAPPSKIASAGIEADSTLVANGLRLVAQGVTSIEEIQRLGALE